MSLSDRLGRTDAEGAQSFPHAPTLRDLTGPSNAADNSAVRLQVQQHLARVLGQQLYSGQLSPSELEHAVFEAIGDVLSNSDKPLTNTERAQLVQEIVDDLLGHGPIESLLRDTDVTEIMVNTYKDVFVERHGKLYRTDFRFDDEEHLRRTIQRIAARVGRRVDESSPMVDARLPDGSRINAVVPPIALDGSSLTIRKFANDPFTMPNLISMGTFTKEAAEVIEGCVKGKLNILISGGTGSGKTTTLNVLSSFIPENERIITIEDAAELQLNQPHVVRLESRPPNVEGQGQVTIRDLVRNALRMRPDRIVVGEVRDAAALDMLQAMNTGHEGSITTLHANSTRDALSRLETMVLMAGMELPVRVIREQIVLAIDLIVQQSRMTDGSRHITAISEVVGLEGETILMQDIFTYDHSGEGKKTGRLVPTGMIPRFESRLQEFGVNLPRVYFQK